MTTVKEVYEVRKGQYLVEFLCDFCSSETVTRKSHYDRKRRHFCSQQCYSSYRRELLAPNEHNRYGTGVPPVERAKRVKARSDLNHAINQGKISRRNCEVEGCGDWGEAHHDDYDKPLEVRFLCFEHHREWHKLVDPLYENPELLEAQE